MKKGKRISFRKTKTSLLKREVLGLSLFNAAICLENINIFASYLLFLLPKDKRLFLSPKNNLFLIIVKGICQGQPSPISTIGSRTSDCWKFNLNRLLTSINWSIRANSLGLLLLPTGTEFELAVLVAESLFAAALFLNFLLLL